jgi:hypothetical protein
MLKRLIPRLFLVALLSVAVSPAFAQVNPSATSQGGASVPVVIGFGFSNFAMDWGPGQRMNGVTLWADLYPFRGGARDLGFQFEGRDINFMRTIPNLREDTAQFGVIYNISHFRSVHPFGKFISGVGSMDFPGWSYLPKYHHDTFLVTTPGAGVDIHTFNGMWVRAEYQYQTWHNVFGPNSSNPNGFTIGAQWDFRKRGVEY